MEVEWSWKANAAVLALCQHKVIQKALWKLGDCNAKSKNWRNISGEVSCCWTASFAVTAFVTVAKVSPSFSRMPSCNSFKDDCINFWRFSAVSSWPCSAAAALDFFSIASCSSMARLVACLTLRMDLTCGQFLKEPISTGWERKRSRAPSVKASSKPASSGWESSSSSRIFPLMSL